ncbi:MAG: tRNA (adenosine(37)-N6)-threonylcarbamoyltransferase complex ATPase subunit type 1 TsaE [Patescibacteria group bacterium]
MERLYTEADTDAIAEILSLLQSSDAGATILALEGDLGAGKTTLTKALAARLGVTDTVVSPTFVIAKFYGAQHDAFNALVHMDAYRIESLEELGPLGWEALLAQPRTLLIIEWPEKIRGALPEAIHHFKIVHSGDQRTITKIQ